ncbi:MAG: biopolymer transporter ExbD [Gallionella sp.]
MKSSRRLKRMDRRDVTAPTVTLTSLMDIFIVIVIYLLMNQALGVDIVAPPKVIKLPESVVEKTPRQTVVMTVSSKVIIVQGEQLATVAEVIASDKDYIENIGQRMVEIRESYIGISDEAIANSVEVTIMADKSVPFKVLKRMMSTSGSAGYNKISLAVNSKEKK